jgi:hypothetical protein
MLLMNERIKELAVTAGIKVPTHIKTIATDKNDLEKFAELIIQECVYVVDNAVLGREPASTYVEKILNHFEI